VDEISEEEILKRFWRDVGIEESHPFKNSTAIERKEISKTGSFKRYMLAFRIREIGNVIHNEIRRIFRIR